MTAIKLSDHFGYGRLVRFALPSIAMMIFTSIYSVVDGLFVSNFAGKEALAAVNLVFPLAMGLGSVGFMLGTGGAALVAKTMGEGDAVRANRLFSFIALAAVAAGAVLAVAGVAVLEPLLAVLGAQGSLMDQGLLYGRILVVALPLFIVQNVFLSFFIAAEKPQMGLVVTVAAGVTNIVLDYLFIAVMGWGIAGAAVATAAGQALAAVAAAAFFARSKTSRLRFTRPLADFRALGAACVNGSSELMTEVAASVVSMLYNYQLMMLVGADGVAAYGVIMYVNFIFVAVFFGFSMGTGPIVSFHFGAQHKDELKGLFRKSMILVGGAGAAMLAASQLLAAPLVGVFVGYDPELSAMTLHGFRIYAVSFLVCGFNIYGSAFFTALNNGKVSALISFMRTLVFETSTVMLLPLAWGIDGVWSAIIVAEACALVLTAAFLVGLRKPYGYA
ncbi:MATE family efflux transporter [Gordonibacter sp. 28C]|uniref:MATE family efflux transporter n=1 Tax=Gordonibacter sp. 28C TaxID=2078569 RepID=UPI000DF7BB70|nr:MATE family efflux transporter [Gordonibacter sp. 28C]RDB61224.1 MATE family efflux transporter [Gordonibacter sp. 28C]